MSQIFDIESILQSNRTKVIAVLHHKLKHIDLAEDCYQEASIRALKYWPENGMPSSPVAWLITVSKNIATDMLRKLSTSQTTEYFEHLYKDNNEGNVQDKHQYFEPDLDSISFEQTEFEIELDKHFYKDDVLRLLFCCCHDELKPSDQVAIALKVVGGFSTIEIAKALLVKEKTMEQRITRAKNKAYFMANNFEARSKKEKLQRLNAVMGLIYLIFNEGYSKTGGDTHIDIDLCNEAIRLAYLLNELFNEPELKSLLALLCYQHSRAESRLDALGQLLTFEQQDRTLWQQSLIKEGNQLLKQAAAFRHDVNGHKNIGIYELQASIASQHSNANKAEDTRWDKILALYDELFEIKSSAVVALNRCVALSKVYGAEQALIELEHIASHLKDYIYFHTVRAGLLKELHRNREARHAYSISLTLNPTKYERKYIEAQLSLLI